jgi:hypothetical protein
VAVFAMSAVVAVSSASAALPEFSKFPVKFTSTSKASFLEASKKKIECTADKNTGEITGAKTDKVVVTFTGCTTLSGLVKCGNTKTAGEIETTALISTLGYIKKAAPTEVGLSLKPATGTLFAKFECATEVIEVGEGTEKGGDSIIGKITPINTSTTAYTLTFKCVSGVQEFTKFEAPEPLDVLETKIGSGAWERSCQNSEDAITLATAAEIKA